MFELGGNLQELLLILVVALLVVGPKRLPEVGRALARAVRELRRAQDDLRSTLEENLQVDEPVAAPAPPGLGLTETASVAAPQAPASAVDTCLMGPTAEPARAGVVEPYLAQRGARLFHVAACRWASCIKVSERLTFDSKDGATALGLLPCPVCQPSSA